MQDFNQNKALIFFGWRHFFIVSATNGGINCTVICANADGDIVFCQRVHH